jgi:ABC-type Na+ efflux pump permease subunit
MSFSWARVGAILQKELRDYRRNRFVVLTMSILPLIFIAAPMVQLFTINVSITSAKLDTRIGISLLCMLILPAAIPSVLSAYSVVGEREQGTLEPVLTTPIHREEFLVGKALATLLPTLAVRMCSSGSSSAPPQPSPIPPLPRRSSNATTSSSSCSSPRSSPDGRSGSASPSPPA